MTLAEGLDSLALRELLTVGLRGWLNMFASPNPSRTSPEGALIAMIENALSRPKSSYEQEAELMEA